MICVKLKATAIPKTANGNENGKYSFSIFLFLRAQKPILVKFSVNSYQSIFLKSICSLNSEYLTPKIIYRADASKGTNHDKRFSFSLTDTPLEEMCRNHTRDFNMKSVGIALNRLNISGN